MTDAVIQILDSLPLVAILRGLEPDEAVDVGEAIVAAGFRCVEVPLNSPRPFDSIRRLRDALDGRAVVGAGTVLEPAMVGSVVDAGGQIIISPNTDPDVIETAKAAGLAAMPGFFTPSEAFVALAAGADVLKLFPSEIAGPAGLKAVRAVLPAGTRVYAVGGVEPPSVSGWIAAGASGFGLGSAIFTPGRSVEEISRRATAFVTAWSARSD